MSSEVTCSPWPSLWPAASIPPQRVCREKGRGGGGGGRGGGGGGGGGGREGKGEGGWGGGGGEGGRGWGGMFICHCMDHWLHDSFVCILTTAF